MIENSFAARPQSGLIFADVVFEVVDEYGITRFVAIYNSNDAYVWDLLEVQDLIMQKLPEDLVRFMPFLALTPNVIKK